MKGVTTSFTRSEFLAVIKESLANQSKAVPSQTVLDNALATLDKFINQMGIEYYSADDLANVDGKLFSDSNDRVESSTPILGKDGDWRGLNGADSLILTLAERTKANKLATNDDGFKGIKSTVSALVLREIY